MQTTADCKAMANECAQRGELSVTLHHISYIYIYIVVLSKHPVLTPISGAGGSSFLSSLFFYI